MFKTLASTNTTLKEMSSQGFGHGTVVIADGQTEGRGRLGRSFYSPPGTGLYISFLLSPSELGLPDITWVTAMAGLAVCEGAEALTGVTAKIKWVNDVYIGGKKVCGILTEAVNSPDNRGVAWLVAGIGINVTTVSFPGMLEDTAASLTGSREEGQRLRCRLAARLMDVLLTPGAWPDIDTLRERYRARQLVLGREITVHAPENTYQARAVDIDDAGRLVVLTPDGHHTSLMSGEVSVRI